MSHSPISREDAITIVKGHPSERSFVRLINMAYREHGFDARERPLPERLALRQLILSVLSEIRGTFVLVGPRGGIRPKTYIGHKTARVAHEADIPGVQIILLIAGHPIEAHHEAMARILPLVPERTASSLLVLRLRLMGVVRYPAYQQKILAEARELLESQPG